MSEVTDLALVQRCLNGDKRAYGTLVERHQTVMYNIALRMTGNREDAKDLTQNVFIKAFENLKRFKPEHKFFSWIYRMLVNESINFLRKRRSTVELQDYWHASEETAEDVYYRAEVSKAITSALMDIRLDYRIVIILRHFLDFTYREMSEIVGIPEKTVKSRLYSARQILGGILMERGVVGNG